MSHIIALLVATLHVVLQYQYLFGPWDTFQVLLIFISCGGFAYSNAILGDTKRDTLWQVSSIDRACARAVNGSHPLARFRPHQVRMPA